ncbi:MAG TPA: hypothetical protein DDY98_04360 [Ruminococcaceae bacterium]|nr:hypothetical protein [Oscillospiraceae bacterium]
MKNKRFKALALLMCFAFLFSVAAPGFTMETSANSTLDLPEELKSAVEKFANVLIDVIHRCLLVIRYPWEPQNINTIDLSKFTLVFEDEFDGKKLDMSVWNHYRQGQRKGGYWDKGQAFLRDGNLVIQTTYRENGKYGAGYYCDRIDTRNKYEQTYGYFECRCILPAAQGLWSAFWLSSENATIDGNPGTNGAEIDVFESPLWYRGEKGLNNNLVTSNIHCGGYSLQTKYKNVAISKAINPYTQYNTYGLEWNKDGYIFYINGIETGRSKFGGVSEVPEYMLLSTEIDGVDGVPFYGWSGIITANKADALPAEFIVDYVRAYQYNDLLNAAD